MTDNASGGSDAQRPDTRRLTRAVRVLGRWGQQKVEAAKGIPDKKKALLSEAANEAALKAFTIKGLTFSEKCRVSARIRAAYWSANASAKQRDAIISFLGEHYSITLIVGVALYVILIPFNSPFFAPNLDEANRATTYFVSLTMPLGPVIFIWVIVSLKRVHKWLAIMLQMAIGASLLALSTSRDIRTACLAQLEDLGVMSFKWHSISLQHVDTSAGTFVCRMYTTLFIFWALAQAIDFYVLRIGPQEPRGAVACSTLLLQLFELALLADKAVALTSKDPRVAEAEHLEGLRPYLASDIRTSIVTQLNSVARYAEGGWRRSLRTRDRSADAETTKISEGIAVAARRWKSPASSGGSNLPQLQAAFTQALMDAVEEDWSALAADVTPSEVLWRKVIRILRRLAALSVFACAAILVTTKPAGWMMGHNPVFDSVTLLVAGLIALSIDPSITELTGNAAKVAGNFGIKK